MSDKEEVIYCSNCGVRAEIIEGKLFCLTCCSPIKKSSSDNK